jgi:hypothetical protein
VTQRKYKEVKNTKKQIFKGKYVKLVLDSGFVIYGTIEDIDEQGLFFRTTTGTSFLRWDTVKSIVERTGGY